MLTVSHQRVESKKPFETAIKDFLSQVGQPQAQQISDAAHASDKVEAFKALEGTSGLMIFNTIDFGSVIPSFREIDQKAKQYLIGNPLIAEKMLKFNHEVALYVPLRVLITATEGGTAFVYDLPSSLLGPLHNNIIPIAKDLDSRLSLIVERTLF